MEKVILPILYLFGFVYVVFVLYLEYLTNISYLKYHPDKPVGFKKFLFFISGYYKKINYLRGLKDKDAYVLRALWIDGFIKKLSLAILGLVVVLIIFKKRG